MRALILCRRMPCLLVPFVFVALVLGAALPTVFPTDAASAQPTRIVTAGVDDFAFESMDVEYVLGRADDGTSTLHVTETFVALFPDFDQNRGMRRTIPTEYLGAPLRPHFVSITDENGASRPSEVDEEDGWFSMTSRADDYVHGRQVYVFTYTLENVTRYFADTDDDEFYWNVNGTSWAQPFGRVTASLTLEHGLPDALTGDMACYRGAAGDTTTCDIDIVDGAVVASATALDPRQTMTIAVGFESGTFAAFDPSPLRSVWGWLQLVVGFGLIAALVWAIVMRSRHMRDAPGRLAVIAEYLPPPGIDALESAVFLHKTAKAVPAEVLEQAVAGSIRILEGERKIFGGTKLIAELVDPSRAEGDGRMLLRALFPAGHPGEQYEFGRTDTRVSKAAQRMLADAKKALNARGLRRKVPARFWLPPGALAAVAGPLAMVFGINALEQGYFAWWVIALLALGIPLMLAVMFVLAKSPLTASGAELRDHLAGLREFIEWAEADRIRMLQSPQGAERRSVDVHDPRQMLHLYEALLPFAVVFGQEKKWAGELAVLYDVSGSPRWYVGSSTFDATSFSARIATLSASAAASSSTSSSSGGSSGGGSAGGGGGGGGGGGV
ncbi:DUF2207 domain-containing protein [Microbacterium sp. C7(2022)]|uniref:DUF2207 domain-containing protein n=1 Tax=Microbacterium sp. C7(2022) TaxID=2992759 RepID=UPI00237B29E5|nr:DUF2207 domain-containing protein [Microbacterium sp. C7(2022)]MDE0546226.1 DUF2207 domain-containing protein [Microbacterium sp. C7(2022)]